MPQEFLEERISINIKYETSYENSFANEITQTSGDTSAASTEYRRLIHPYQRRRFSISYQLDKDIMYDEVEGLHDRCYAKHAGFRFKHFEDYTTNQRTKAPTATDQVLLRIGAGIYQLQTRLGTTKPGLGSLGWPIRTIFKPVSGTVNVAINGTPQPTGWTVNTTTGVITFAADPGSGAVVTAGCEFDFPVRFDSELSVLRNHPTSRMVEVELIELLTL